VREDEAFPGEGVEVGRAGIGVAVAAEDGAHVFGDDPEDVGFFE